MKKIFLVCYGGGHVRMIKNIYEELIKEKELEVKIFALTEGQKFLSNLNIPCMSMEKYHEIIKDEEAEKIGLEIIKELNLNFNDKESILYYGYSFKELIKKYGKTMAIEGYLKFGRRAFLALNFMRKVLEYEKPNIVIATSAPRLEKAALIIAKKLAIISISIEDLFGIEMKEDYELANYFNDTNYKYQYGTYMCVLSEEIKKFLTKKTNSKIIVTGNPNFDSLIRIKNQISKINIDKKYYVITFLSQPNLDQIKYIKKMLDILRKYKNYFVIFKFHPTEDIETYKSIFNENQELKSRYILLKDKLYESIKTADLVITRTSTAGLEASILGKKIIGEKNIYIPFKELKIGLEFSDLDELEKLIKSIDRNKSKEKIFYNNELASVNIKNVILNLLNNEK